MKQSLLELMNTVLNAGSLTDSFDQTITFVPLNNETIIVSGFTSYNDAMDSNRLMDNGDVHFSIKSLITRFVVGDDENMVDVYVKWDSGKWIFGVSTSPALRKMPEWPIKIFPNEENPKDSGVQMDVPFAKAVVHRVV